MPNLENYADIDRWIAIGGGNHTSVDELLELGYNQQQIDYLCTLSPTNVVQSEITTNILS